MTRAPRPFPGRLFPVLALLALAAPGPALAADLRAAITRLEPCAADPTAATLRARAGTTYANGSLPRISCGQRATRNFWQNSLMCITRVF